LNANNKLCDLNRNELVFANSIDTGASDSGYPDLDPDLDLNKDKGLAIKLEKWIFTDIELQIRKNNVLITKRIVKRSAKKA
jgi:hypothetical protein